MDFKELFKFIDALQRNNNKEWMDENRKWYFKIRDSYIAWLETMDAKLAKIDPDYTHTPGKKAINRINNNLLFHPDRPTYKDHFGAGLDQVSKQGDFYIQIGKENFIAGGYYKPKAAIVKSIRQALDYNGEDLLAILDKKSFKDVFELIDDGVSLKTSPKGFPADHKFIDLLRKKTFAVQANLTRAEIMKPDFDEKVIAIYKEMLPFRRYLNQAVTV
ncbi:DUF2461 domain-containing protein [Leeuwenhoekiella sp. A16]|uniref:DUF2461 domain-containing protein n=1 Tax=Leeuwenhoekiella sp. A16 TaxID=3141462 RepID=UPI003A7FF347